MSARTLRPVRSETADVDFLLAQTRADDARRAKARLAREAAGEAATETADALLRLVIAVIESETDPGVPTSTLTIRDATGVEIGTYQLPETAGRQVAGAIQAAMVDFLGARGVDPVLINRLAGGDAEDSTSSDHRRPALRAINGGAR